jgi:DNA-binding ferritin-like protein
MISKRIKELEEELEKKKKMLNELIQQQNLLIAEILKIIGAIEELNKIKEKNENEKEMV